MRMIGRLKMKYFIALLITIYPFTFSNAEENGSGMYTPGAIASAIDSMLPAPGFILRPNYYNYNGVYDVGCISAGCADTLYLKASSKAVSLTAGWKPEAQFSDKWSYMFSITVPYVYMDVSTYLTSGATTSTTRDSNVGLGDMEIIPINISYHKSAETQYNFKSTLRAPTGEYETNQLANIGKNYWSFEPTVGIIHVSADNTLQFSAYAGLNFNTENDATDYKSGTQSHVEFTTERRFLSSDNKGVWGVGVTGFYYRQLTDDSVSGVKHSGKQSPFEWHRPCRLLHRVTGK